MAIENITSNVVVPIIQAIVYTLMIGGFLYFIYMIFKRLFPNLRWAIKYKMFKKNYKEEDIELCMDLQEKGLDEIGMKKYLLLKVQNPKKVKELLYINKQILNVLKGGQKK